MRAGRTGSEAELRACLWLSGQGYEVFKNVHPHGPADLVAWKPGADPLLIDVKSVRPAAHGELRQMRHYRASPEEVRILVHNAREGTFHWNADLPPRRTRQEVSESTLMSRSGRESGFRQCVLELLEAPRCAEELARELKCKPSKVYRVLAKLREEGAVRSVGPGCFQLA